MVSKNIIKSKPLIKRVNSLKLDFSDSSMQVDQSEVFSFLKKNVDKTEIVGF